MKKLINTILIIAAILGICAMSGSMCPDLTDTEQTTNFTVGAALFFGSAGTFFLMRRG